MGQINLGRVLGGGLLAGLVINVGEVLLNEVVLGDAWEAAWAALGVVQSPAMIALFMIYGFLLGLGSVWLYAAIRPRFGPGLRTAVIAGLASWFLAYFLFGLMNLATDVFPQGIVWFVTAWGLVEIPLGTAVGAALYKEEAALAPEVEQPA